MKLPLYLVAGTRPNFIKLAPLVRVLNTAGHSSFQIVHTGQHYDHALSASFFRTLDIPPPDINLEVGSGSHGAQTARIIERFEALLMEAPAHAVLVFGDVNSTLACAVAASKLMIPVIHVEAGLRCFDRNMPEEINRIVTDALSDLMLVSEHSGLVNLGNEGIPQHKIKFVGNIMIDSLERMLPLAIERRTHQRFGMQEGEYGFVTMHRPSNVDDPETLAALLGLFDQVAADLPLLFAVHPRTRKAIQALDPHFQPGSPAFQLVEPLDYLDSLCMQKHARLILTDSGGIQEESAHLSVPCLTLRENTERPVTVELGTSTLVGNHPERIQAALQTIFSGDYKQASPIPLWDGHTAERIAGILENF